MLKDDFLSRLRKIIGPMTRNGILLSFSGGCDSSLLLTVLAMFKKEKDFPLMAAFCHGPFQTSAELIKVKAVASALQVKLMILTPSVLDVEEIRNNDKRRCYYCKHLMFSMLKEIAANNNFTVMDGTNADDLKEYRPGQTALKELGIRSPLAEAGFSKADIRALAAELNIPSAADPSSPCLATRFPYGTVLTEKDLRKVEKSEAYLKKIGLSEFRVRCHDDLARIEVNGEDAAAVLLKNKAEIISHFSEYGFQYVTLDLKRFQSGSFDKNTNIFF